MKKIALTIAIVLAMGVTTFAQHSMFGKSSGERERGADLTTPMIVDNHNYDQDVNGNGETDLPLGSGIAVLVGLGAAYMVAKKRKEE